MQNYHLLNQIGEGSFGRVYKARRKYTGRLVAIKMINKLGQTKEDLQSFRGEISILRKADHPNIMRMLEIFETDTDFCLVTELARGDLFQIISDNQTLPEEILKKVAFQLLSALNYLHIHRVIHRDIKPQNVLISMNGNLKLCDFGFARSLSNNTIMLNSVKGTPLYMAPELVQEQQYNERVDIWSLGIILYELFYGKPPYYTNSIYKLIQMIVNDPITWPGPISEQFKDVLKSMLQKDPSARYSCDAVLKFPFFNGLDSTMFDDMVYRFKAAQFEEAIKENANNKTEPTQKKYDFQTIIVNHASYSNEDIIMAIKGIRDTAMGSDSPLVASFVYQYKDFLTKPPNVIEEVLKTSSYIISMNYEKYVPSFIDVFSIIGKVELPKTIIDFIVEILVVPFAKKALRGQVIYEEISFEDNKAEKLKDKMMGFLFSSKAEDLSRTYAALYHISKSSSSFLSYLSGSFVSQIVPILASSVIHQNNHIVSGFSLSLLSVIINKNNSAVQFIQPISDFISSLSSILSTSPKTHDHFCMLCAMIVFIGTTFSILTQINDFQRLIAKRECLSSPHSFLSQFYSSKPNHKDILLSLIRFSTVLPSKQNEFVAFSSYSNSVFEFFPILPSFLGEISPLITSVLPIHQNPLVSSALRLPYEHLRLFIYNTINSLFEKNFITSDIINVFFVVIKNSFPDSISLCKDLMTSGIIQKLIQFISNTNNPHIALGLLVLIVISEDSQSQSLIDNSKDLIKFLATNELYFECLLIVSTHLLRLSQSFVTIIEQYEVFSNSIQFLAKKASENMRQRIYQFIGFYSIYNSIKEENVEKTLSFLLKDLKVDSIELKKSITFALGNIIYLNPSLSSIIIENIDSFGPLLDSTELRILDHTVSLVCNCLRSSDQHLQFLVQKGIIDKLVNLLRGKDEIAYNVLPKLTILCKYEESKKYLKGKGLRSYINKMKNCKSEKIQAIAQKMISLIDS